ncbi:MAG: TIGR04283 family arsenosugar biosynthesis glycosyltransferase [Halioglobus sp.]
MHAGVSFVIPVLNEQSRVAALLRDLRKRYPGCELIVVDGGSRDLTVAQAMPLCDQLLLGERGRAAQMNLGARVASSAYLCFLHADCRPEIGAPALEACLTQLPDWGFCRVRLSGGQWYFRVIEWFMNQRSRLTSVATGDQMLFLQKRVFEETGGFDAIPLMEDVAYCKRLRRLAKPVVVRQPVVAASRRWEEDGVVRTVLRMWGLRLAYALGVAPATLWRCYYGR